MNLAQKHHLHKLRNLLEASIGLKDLASKRRKLYNEAKDKKKEINILLVKEYQWLLKSGLNTYKILAEIGMDFENHLYSLKRKFREKERKNDKNL